MYFCIQLLHEYFASFVVDSWVSSSDCDSQPLCPSVQLRFVIYQLLGICRPSGRRTPWCGVVVVVGVCNRSQMRTSKCTCLLFGVNIGLDPARRAQEEFLIGQSSRSHATYRLPSLDGFYSFSSTVIVCGQSCSAVILWAVIRSRPGLDLWQNFLYVTPVNC